jgi:hypothetical protein
MQLIRLLPTGAAFLLVGCGAVMHGSRQSITVVSSPSAVKVETSPLTGTFTTPTTLNLERKNSYVLNFSSPGYTPATFNITNSIGTGTVIADVLLTGLIGVIVDGATGSWYGLNPDAVTIALTKAGSGPGPEQIHIHLDESKSGPVKIESDAPGIPVQVQVQVKRK